MRAELVAGNLSPMTIQVSRSGLSRASAAAALLHLRTAISPARFAALRGSGSMMISMTLSCSFAVASQFRMWLSASGTVRARKLHPKTTTSLLTVPPEVMRLLWWL